MQLGQEWTAALKTPLPPVKQGKKDRNQYQSFHSPRALGAAVSHLVKTWLNFPVSGCWQEPVSLQIEVTLKPLTSEGKSPARRLDIYFHSGFYATEAVWDWKCTCPWLFPSCRHWNIVKPSDVGLECNTPKPTEKWGQANLHKQHRLLSISTSTRDMENIESTGKITINIWLAHVEEWTLQITSLIMY